MQLADLHIANFPEHTGYQLVEIPVVNNLKDLFKLTDQSINIPNGRLLVSRLVLMFQSMIALHVHFSMCIGVWCVYILTDLREFVAVDMQTILAFL